MTANTFRSTRNCIVAATMTVVTIVAGKRMTATTMIAAGVATTKEAPINSSLRAQRSNPAY
jgi:hypothetical protein